MKQAEKKVALVTGASSGIGLATAMGLVEAGYRVFGTTRTFRPMKPEPDFEILQLDVTSDESVSKTIDDVMRKAGRIDLVVNNAGRGVGGGAEESSIKQAIGLFDTNVFGMMRMTRQVLPIFRKQQGGRIINISSVLGLIPAPYSALYASTKHAMEGYSESLDHEVRTSGIRVILVEPAFTRTRFAENMSAPDEPLPLYDAARTAQQKAYVEIEATADSPDVVARAVVMAATAINPQIRYTAGKIAAKVSMLRRFVPSRMFDKSLRKELKLQ